MKRGVNKVILIGNVGGAPETKSLVNNSAVTIISMATAETWKDKTTGKPSERTEWHRIVFYDGLSQIAGKIIQKGAKLYVEGSLRTRKWQAQDGTDRYSTEINANYFEILTGQSSENGGDGFGDYEAMYGAAQSPIPDENNNY